jgi:hypothetical protein
MYLAAANQGIHNSVPIGSVTRVKILARAPDLKVIVEFEWSGKVTAADRDDLFATESAAWLRVSEIVRQKRAEADLAWQEEINRCMKNCGEHLHEPVPVG